MAHCTKRKTTPSYLTTDKAAVTQKLTAVANKFETSYPWTTSWLTQFLVCDYVIRVRQ